MTDVHQAICGVISDLPAIGKTETGKGLTYTYRGVETIKAELKPLLAARGVHYAPHRIKHVADEAYQVKGGSWWRRTLIEVRWRIYGPDGSHIEATTRGEGSDNSDKGSNKAMTVAEKQMLLAVFAIADGTRDPDHERAPEADPVSLAPAVQVTVAGLKGALLAKVNELDPEPADPAALATATWIANDPGPGPWTPEAADAVLEFLAAAADLLNFGGDT